MYMYIYIYMKTYRYTVVQYNFVITSTTATPNAVVNQKLIESIR